MSSDQVFTLPDLGEGLTEAEVIEWHVAVGDQVRIDQDVVTVETAKAAVAVPCPFAGTVATLHGEPGHRIDVGQPLITIRPEGSALVTGAGAEQYRAEEQAGASAPDRPLVGYGAAEPARRRSGSRRRPSVRAASTVESGHTPVPDRAAEHEPAPVAVRVISPLVRKLAADAGIDLKSIRPCDPSGVIRRADIEIAVRTADAAAGSAVPTAEDVTASASRPTSRPTGEHDRRIPITGVRRAISEKLTRSRSEIPDATTWVDVDATELIAARDTLRRLRPDAGIGILALLARIVVAGLRRYPELNSSVDTSAGEIIQHGSVHLSIAAQSPRGLMVPVVRDADRLSTAELAGALRELSEGARAGTLSPAQLSGGTFTLNNYGVFGVDGSTPIINHPEAAMLGVGRIIDRPWARHDELVLRKVTQLSLTFDHRVCDGQVAGGLLRYVADAVESPAALLADV